MFRIWVFLVLMALTNTTRSVEFTWLNPDGIGGGDYAADRLDMPWAMDSSDGMSMNQLDQISFENGILNAVTTGVDPWIWFELDPWDRPNADRYKVAAVAMKRSPGGPAFFHWKIADTGWHAESFSCPDGEWVTVAIDFTGIPAWEDELVHLRLDPALSADVTISVDWVSLTEGDVADDSFLIAWDLGHAATVTFEASLFGQNNWWPLPEGTELVLDAGPGELTWDTSQLQSGAYQLRAQIVTGQDATTSYCENLVRVNRAPSLNVTLPVDVQTILEGKDKASLAGNPWDMNGYQDISDYGGLSDVSFTGGVFRGLSTGNAWILFPSETIDTQTYSLMAWRMRVSDETAWNVYWKDSVGSWHHTPLQSTARAGEWATYIVDLSAVQSWTGQVHSLRLDPTGASGIWIDLDWVRLVEPGTASITTQWQSYDEEGFARVSVDFVSSVGQEHRLITNHQTTNGQDALELDVSVLPPGDYEVAASLDDLAHPLTSDTADGMVRIESRDNMPPEITVLSPSPNDPRLPDVGEFSRDVLEDPWDFNQLSDGILFQNMHDISIENGVFSAVSTSNDPAFWLLHEGYGSAQNVGKNGQQFPIDPGTYKLASWRMYLDTASSMQIFWYRGATGTDTTQHIASEWIPISQGWHTYSVRLDTLDTVGMGTLGPWGSCDVINGLRIDPSTAANCTIKIDWFRLSEIDNPETEATVAWIVEDDLQNATVEVFFDVNSNGFDGDRIWGPGEATGLYQSFGFQTAYLPYPGGHIYVSADDGVNPPVMAYAPGAIVKNAPPLLWVREPDELGPDEFAIEVQGNSWDMDGWDDVTIVNGIEDPEFVDGEFRGTAANDDPHMFLTLDEPINTRRYAAAHFRQWSDRWTVLRLIWQHTTNPPAQWQTTDDFVVYPGWNEYRVPDLTEIIIEPDDADGWVGEIKGNFTFHPSEMPGCVFRVDYVHLLTHDMADEDFTLKWELEDPDDAVSLSWFWKGSPESPDSHFIASVPNSTSGVDSLLWDMSNLASGTYYIYCIADDGLNATKHGAHGDLILNRKPSLTFSEPNGEGDVVDVAPDFAGTVLGDQWDMNEESDIDLVVGFDNASISWENGVFSGVTETNDPAIMWALYGNPIDADAYETLSFRMYIGSGGNPQSQFLIYWQHEQGGPWYHSNFIPAVEGWHTYVVNLEQDCPATWNGNVKVFRIDPTSHPGVTVKFDWIRLTIPGSTTFTLSWADADQDDNARIDITAYAGSWMGDEIPIVGPVYENSGIDEYTWDTSPFWEGAYYFKATLNDSINAPVDVLCPYPLFIGEAELIPVEIDATISAPGVLTLDWEAPGTGVSEYRIYRSSDPHTGFSLHDVTQSTFYEADLGNAGENPDLNYFFRVTWVNNADAESPPSNTVGEVDFAYF